MYLDKKILVLVPARGGSKGIKDKNIRELCGKPLISYTIEAALNSKYVDSTVVTTDSLEISEVAKKYGALVPFLRPAELASDSAKTIDAVVHAVNSLKQMQMEYDVLVLLQPTQPLRTSQDIDNAIELFFENNMCSLVSVSPVDDNPLLIRTLDEFGRVKNLIDTSSTCRRQDMPAYYRVNGCIYINSIDEVDAALSFNDNRLAYVMTREHSVDIDEMKDLYLAEWYMCQMK